MGINNNDSSGYTPHNNTAISHRGGKEKALGSGYEQNQQLAQMQPTIQPKTRGEAMDRSRLMDRSKMMQRKPSDASVPLNKTEDTSNDEKENKASMENKQDDKKKNILIWLDTKENIEESYKDDRGNNGTFYQIVTSDIHEAAIELERYLGEDIYVENVIIATHGGPGVISLGKAINYGDIANYMLEEEHNFKDKKTLAVHGLKYISSKIIDGGKLVITGCNSGYNLEVGGNGMEGVDLGEALRLLTDNVLHIFLNQDFSARRISNIYGNKTVTYPNGSRGPEIIDQDIWITGAATEDNAYRKGWVEIPPEKGQKELKDDKKGVRGILHFNAYKGKEPITVK